MSAREQLAEVIRDGEGTWRTPLEAADAILASLDREWGVMSPGGRVRQTCYKEADARILAGPYESPVSRQVTAWEVTK